MSCPLCKISAPDQMIAVPVGLDGVMYIKRPHNKDTLTTNAKGGDSENKSIQKSRAGKNNRKPSA